MPHGCSGSPLPSGALEKASQYAGELVSRAQQNPRDWKHGNAIHDGNSVMGLVALRGGNVAQAGKYLLEAGKTPGSPQLNSFGPNMTLAKQLLEQGEKTVVLEYLSECRTFWKMGGANLTAWTATVQAGGVPNFGANLLY